MARAKEQTQRHVVPFHGNRFGLVQHTVLQFNVFVPAGTPREDLTDSRLWAHVANKIGDWSEIRVVEEEGAYMARLLVTFKRGIDLRIKELEFYDLKAVPEGEEEVEAVDDPDYFVKSRGAVLRWCIVRKSDGSNVQEGMPDEMTARKALADYLKVLGRG